MDARADLEEALAACWNSDDLTVYADLLLADNDPRGELIALDLRPRPDDDDWQARRIAAATRWLGSNLAQRARALIRYAFVEELDDSKRHGNVSSALLSSPAGAYVRRFVTRGQATKVRATILELAGRPRPFLTQLEVGVRGTSRDVCVSVQAMSKLTAATPRLRELEVRGRRVLAAVAHPALRRLHLSNHDSVLDIERPEGDAAGFLRVTCETASGQYALTVPADELRRALTAIDLSRTYDDLYEHHAEVFGESLPSLLARLDAAGLIQLTLGMPVLTTSGRSVVEGARPPPIQRTLERPIAPIQWNPYGNNVWLETKKQISFVAHIHTLSQLACQWLARLPLSPRLRRVVEELLDLLYALRRTGRATAQDSVSGNLEILLRQLTALEAAGVDPTRAGEISLWHKGWPDVRDGAYREILRAGGVRMTFAVR